ncbi:hypothetical protein K488DRAFT_43750 [Vararia minispora EC-137]|uniref:Uncharacterized protein n=1 Tax=Vararia minispora EC-137 TaxID=1314806 RepID=A0ACB8QTW4_9AGAM|nr:hypothetical protein K488DRAFT_43750 [Vararia minispora EC-137]
MDRLPVELLLDIFFFCVHQDALATVVLSHVSAKWRAILAHTPRVHQLVVLDDAKHSPRIANALAHYSLQRSDPLPFDVHLTVMSRDSLLPFLSPFLGHLQRWRSFHIEGIKAEDVRFSDLWDNEGGAPSADQLDITMVDADVDMHDPLAGEEIEPEDDETPALPTGTFRQNATPLTSNLLYMELMCAALPQPLHVTPLAFASLVVTEASPSLSLRPADLLRFLCACPALEFFQFTGIMNEPEIGPADLATPPPIVPLLHLRSLVLHSTLCTRILLSYIHAPNLRELYLEHLNVDWRFPLPLEPFEDYELEDGDSDDEFPDFSQSPYSDHATGMGVRSLLRRSAPPLRVLEMDYADMRTKDFRWLFQRVPSLEEFRIVASDMADRVVRLLAPQGKHHDVVLPRMRSLELVNCHRLSGEAILEAVKGRVIVTDAAARTGASEPVPLQDVAIVGCNNFTPEHGAELAELLGDRLRL